MCQHMKRLCKGLAVTAGIMAGACLLIFGALGVMIVPLYLADTYSFWWITLYAIPLLVGAYVIGED